ncbi:MAG: AAA family ATPase [Bacillales bacterium]
MIIIVGPSASGKSVIAKYLCFKYNFKKFITTTTRPIRIGETNNVDYYFIDKDKFLDKIKNNEFVEYVIYNDNYYGSEYKEIGDDKILIVEPKGLIKYLSLKENKEYNDKITTFYIECKEELRKERMIKRKDKLNSINERIILDRKIFNEEIKNKVDYIIDSNINDIALISERIYQLYKENN